MEPSEQSAPHASQAYISSPTGTRRAMQQSLHGSSMTGRALRGRRDSRTMSRHLAWYSKMSIGREGNGG
jgi:hypothetical protein